MNGDHSSVHLMSPCKEQSATLSSFCPQLCPQSCITRALSKTCQSWLPVEKHVNISLIILLMVVCILHLSASLQLLKLLMLAKKNMKVNVTLESFTLLGYQPVHSSSVSPALVQMKQRADLHHQKLRPPRAS